MADQELSLRGINIQEKWAKLIYSGEKIVEARTYKPGCYAGENWLIETPTKPKGQRKRAEITGTIRFGDAVEYSSYDEWRADFKRHRVEPGSAFDWMSCKGKMFGWPILEARRLAEPIPVPPIRGMKGCKEYKARVVFESQCEN